jgi:hypothetical protein
MTSRPFLFLTLVTGAFLALHLAAYTNRPSAQPTVPSLSLARLEPQDMFVVLDIQAWKYRFANPYAAASVHAEVQHTKRGVRVATPTRVTMRCKKAGPIDVLIAIQPMDSTLSDARRVNCVLQVSQQGSTSIDREVIDNPFKGYRTVGKYGEDLATRPLFLLGSRSDATTTPNSAEHDVAMVFTWKIAPDE